MSAQKPTTDNPADVLTYNDEYTKPQPGDDESQARHRLMVKDELEKRDRIRREHAAWEATRAAQQPNKVRWPGSVADLVRLINAGQKEGWWPKEKKWQHAADRLTDRNGKPITARQLGRTYQELKSESPPDRSDLRQVLRNLLC